MDYFLILGKSSPLFVSLLIIVFTIIAGKFVNLIFERFLLKLVGKTKTEFDDQLIADLEKPVFFSTLMIGSYFAFLPWGFSQATQELFIKLLVTATLFIWGWAGMDIVKHLFSQLQKRAEPDGDSMLEDLLPFFNSLTKITLTIVILLTALSLWGINITPALASAGVVGVAVAFAAKDTVANIFGGVSVFLDRPYKSGDYVIIKDKYRGEVIQIGLRSTKIKTRDNVLLTVPNSVMVTDAVVNETGFDPELRIRIPLGVAYGTDLELAEKVLVEETSSHPEIISHPAPRVRYRNFGDFAVELDVLGIISRPADRGRITHELIKVIYSRCQKEKIEIPYPRYDINLAKKII